MKKTMQVIGTTLGIVVFMDILYFMINHGRF